MSVRYFSIPPPSDDRLQLLLSHQQTHTKTHHTVQKGNDGAREKRLSFSEKSLWLFTRSTLALNWCNVSCAIEHIDIRIEVKESFSIKKRYSSPFEMGIVRMSHKIPFDQPVYFAMVAENYIHAGESYIWKTRVRCISSTPAAHVVVIFLFRVVNLFVYESEIFNIMFSRFVYLLLGKTGKYTKKKTLSIGIFWIS